MDSFGRPRYRYEPISSSSIRLLQLDQRPTGEHPITGTLLTRSLHSGPSYTSLSYSWGRNCDGDASLNRVILLDRCELPITENLYDFLVLFTQTNDDVPLLWVDAVCINQEDLEERRAQVSTMADIYKVASGLVMWLGHGASETEDREAMDALASVEVVAEGKWRPHDDKQEIPRVVSAASNGAHVGKGQTKAFTMACKWANRYPENSYRRSDHGLLTRWLLPKLCRYAIAGPCAPETSMRLSTEIGGGRWALWHDSMHIGEELFKLKEIVANLLRSVARICQRRYFNRRWVVQEIHHSQPDRTVIRWGTFSLPANEFCGRLRGVRHVRNEAQGAYRVERFGSEDRHETDFETIASIINFLDSRSTLDLSGRRGNQLLLHCLHAFQHTQCVDDRDLVFAFLSFAGANTTLSADYRLNADEVFITLASALIQDGEIEEVLYQSASQWRSGHRQREDECDAQFPTWVPNYRCAFDKPFWNNPDAVVSKLDHPTPRVTIKGRSLEFQAKIGRTPFKLGQRDDLDLAPQEIEKYEYFCQLEPFDREHRGFFLRALTLRPGYFVLVDSFSPHAYHGSHKVWRRFGEMGIKTVRLI